MKHRLLLFALFTSLAFNIGFLVMFVYYTHNKPKPFMPTPPRGNPRIHQLFRSDEMKQMRQHNIELRKDFFLELAKPEFDSVAVDTIIQRLEDSQKEIEHNILLHFLHIRKDSTPEEAETIFGEFHKRYDENRNRRHNKNPNEENQKRREQ